MLKLKYIYVTIGIDCFRACKTLQNVILSHSFIARYVLLISFLCSWNYLSVFGWCVLYSISYYSIRYFFYSPHDISLVKYVLEIMFWTNSAFVYLWNRKTYEERLRTRRTAADEINVNCSCHWLFYRTSLKTYLFYSTKCSRNRNKYVQARVIQNHCLFFVSYWKKGTDSISFYSLSLVWATSLSLHVITLQRLLKHNFKRLSLTFFYLGYNKVFSF